MIKKTIGMIVPFLVFASPVLAASSVKYTFNDLVIDSQVVEIEASVRSGRNPYSTCVYYSDNYISYLGSYNAAVVAGTNSAAVQSFCVNHFADRVL